MRRVCWVYLLEGRKSQDDGVDEHGPTSQPSRYFYRVACVDSELLVITHHSWACFLDHFR